MARLQPRRRQNRRASLTSRKRQNLATGPRRGVQVGKPGSLCNGPQPEPPCALHARQGNPGSTLDVSALFSTGRGCTISYTEARIRIDPAGHRFRRNQVWRTIRLSDVRLGQTDPRRATIKEQARDCSGTRLTGRRCRHDPMQQNSDHARYSRKCLRLGQRRGATFARESSLSV